jgi:hypothetical protein
VDSEAEIADQEGKKGKEAGSSGMLELFYGTSGIPFSFKMLWKNRSARELVRKSSTPV